MKYFKISLQIRGALKVRAFWVEDTASQGGMREYVKFIEWKWILCHRYRVSNKKKDKMYAVRAWTPSCVMLRISGFILEVMEDKTFYLLVLKPDIVPHLECYVVIFNFHYPTSISVAYGASHHNSLMPMKWGMLVPLILMTLNKGDKRSLFLIPQITVTCPAVFSLS